MNILELYNKEKIINKEFRRKYNYKDEDIFYKQVLELICELSELAYETKCFKYWKDEKQSSAEITIPEFADCLMITLCFCDLAQIEINDVVEAKENNIVKVFIELNKLASSITIDLDKNVLLSILSYLLNVSKLLGYSDEELEKYCNKKMDKTLKMIKV